MSMRQEVRDVLQTGYGDATQTILDDRVAADVVARFRSAGWVSPDELAYIILAAGGEVRVTLKELLATGQREVSVYDDPVTGDKVIRAR